MNCYYRPESAIDTIAPKTSAEKALEDMDTRQLVLSLQTKTRELETRLERLESKDAGNGIVAGSGMGSGSNEAAGQPSKRI